MSACSFSGRFLGRPRGLLIGETASTASSSILESWTFAAVCLTASGTPPASTTRWRFEPCLPRSVGFGPVLSPPGGGHRRRVERGPGPVDLVGLAQAIEQSTVQPPPHARLVPLLEPAPAGHARAASHLLGEHLPGDARLEHEQDARESGPVVDARPAAPGLGGFLGEQRSDDRPQFVGHEWFRHGSIVPVREVLLGILRSALTGGRRRRPFARPSE